MKVVSLTLCRAGSKGLPGKNTKDLCGKPMFAHQIKNLKDAGISDRYVSTDDVIIKSLASEYDFLVIDRPPEISLDTSKCEEALMHFTNLVEYDILVFAQATSPLCKPEYIKKGLQLVLDGKYESVISVCREHWIPRWDLKMNPVDWDPSNRPRRQQKPELFLENGAFYITKKELFLKSNVRYSGKIGYVEMPHYESFQIDTEEDFILIEKLLKGRK